MVSCAGPTLAQDFSLAWPVDCTLGDTCFIEDYHDSDPAEGRSQDYTCGLNTRDQHFGTDIALPFWDADDSGIAVVAAAPGVIFATRDGMADDWRMRGVTSDRACGNAVVIDHAGGWQTTYCHLARGSVAVAKGDRLATGDLLGRIGVSGQTTHPHLHLTLRRDGTRIDPFNVENAACGAQMTSLWADTPDYDATLLRLAGFSTAVPSYETLRAGTARITTADPTDPLVVYAEAGFTEDGDEITITARGPEGEIFRNTRTMENPRQSQLPAFGRRAPTGGWPRGEYLGQITVTRNGRLVANRWAHVTVE
ncbi:MAG: M23 family metallopeptidase [Pseudomonadota bacterium]